MKKINKKGQMGFQFITGLVVMIMSLLFFGGLFPVITQAFGMSKGNDGANCPGYVDTHSTTALGGANNRSYNSALEVDDLSCTIFGFGPGMIVISVIFGLVAGLLSGRLGQTEQQPQYPQYSQY